MPQRLHGMVISPSLSRRLTYKSIDRPKTWCGCAPPPGYNDGRPLSAMPTFTSTMRSSSPKVLPMPSTSSAAKCSTSMIASSVPMMGKMIPLYDGNRSLPRSWTKVMHVGVLGRLSWGGSSTPCKEPSNSPLTAGIASMSYCNFTSFPFNLDIPFTAFPVGVSRF